MVLAQDAASAGQGVLIKITCGLVNAQRPQNPGEGASGLLGA